MWVISCKLVEELLPGAQLLSADCGETKYPFHFLWCLLGAVAYIVDLSPLLLFSLLVSDMGSGVAFYWMSLMSNFL